MGETLGSRGYRRCPSPGNEFAPEWMATPQARPVNECNKSDKHISPLLRRLVRRSLASVSVRLIAAVHAREEGWYRAIYLHCMRRDL